MYWKYAKLVSYHEFEGTDTGLSICKKIAEKPNGYIFAKSKLNEGYVFSFLLPQKIEMAAKLEDVKDVVIQ